MRLSRLWLLLAAAALALSAGVACGDDDDDDEDVDGEPTVEATAPSADGDQIDTSQIEELADGVLTVGNDGAYAPMEFEDESGELVGFAVDLINAMADVLGVETEHPIAGFDSLLPSLEAERYDIVMSSMTVNPERSGSPTHHTASSSMRSSETRPSRTPLAARPPVQPTSSPTTAATASASLRRWPRATRSTGTAFTRTPPRASKILAAATRSSHRR